MSDKYVGRLEMAKWLLDDLLEKRNRHREKIKEKKVNHYGEDGDYYPYQQEQQLIMIRRLLKEGQFEIGSKMY